MDGKNETYLKLKELNLQKVVEEYIVDLLTKSCTMVQIKTQKEKKDKEGKEKFMLDCQYFINDLSHKKKFEII